MKRAWILRSSIQSWTFFATNSGPLSLLIVDGSPWISTSCSRTRTTSTEVRCRAHPTALGFWKALREVWPKAAEQRCWVHRTANVLDKLPKRLQPRAKKHLHEMFQADTKEVAEEQVRVASPRKRYQPWG